MSKIADTLRVLAVALPGFVLFDPQAAADGVQKIGFYRNTERVLSGIQAGCKTFR